MGAAQEGLQEGSQDLNVAYCRIMVYILYIMTQFLNIKQNNNYYVIVQRSKSSWERYQSPCITQWLKEYPALAQNNGDEACVCLATTDPDQRPLIDNLLSEIVKIELGMMQKCIAENRTYDNIEAMPAYMPRYINASDAITKNHQQLARCHKNIKNVLESIPDNCIAIIAARLQKTHPQFNLQKLCAAQTYNWYVVTTKPSEQAIWLARQSRHHAR